MKKNSVFIFFIGALFFIEATFWNINSKTEVFFSPDDKPTSKLIKLIGEVKYKIYAAVYMITDKDIANALIKAKKDRGVDVQVITDKISVESIFGKGVFLHKNGIDLFVFNPPDDGGCYFINNSYQKYNSIMHHKFALLDNKLWTGSFNWTKAANRKNRENIVLLDDEEVCKKYEKCFFDLKTKCFKYVLSEDKKKQRRRRISYEKVKRKLKRVFGFVENKIKQQK